MALSNTATPIYYGKFRDAVMRGEIPVNKEISMEMKQNRRAHCESWNILRRSSNQWFHRILRKRINFN